ncbi:cell division protein FtsA [Bacteroidia bacterium]|nr:cell division protein FtsA [Bacteroidia bacterium]
MEGYVAAVDLGTSKVLAMAARKVGENKLEVIDTDSVHSSSWMLRGRIHDANMAGYKVYLLINNFSPKLPSGLKQIYVGIGGQGLHTEPYSFKKELRGTVTKEMLEYLEANALENPGLLKIETREYYLDGTLTLFPVGQICTEIELKCLQVLARPDTEARKKLEKELSDHSSVEVAGFFVSPLATAEAALTVQQKKDGIALVEIGAALTYVSVYKDNQLKLLVTIPLGGDAITKDITALGIAPAEAENLKRRTGIVLDEIEGTEPPPINQTIRARAIEICSNIFRQIQKQGFEATLKGKGIILTGGGAQLKNFDKLLELESKMPVHLAPLDDHTQACVRGLLLLGTDNCADDEVKVVAAEAKKEEPKKKKGQNWLEKTTTKFVGTLFNEQ